MIATQIKLLATEGISIRWNDNHESIISLNTLRDNCPCASCRGETILLKTYKPSPQPKLPGMYNLVGIEQVGHYAIQLSWGDRHSTGIYPWLHLRNLCECKDCLVEKGRKWGGLFYVSTLTTIISCIMG